MEIKPVSHADEHAGEHGTRRDFLYFATAGAGTVAAGAQVTITTLPAGYRPADETAVAAACGTSGKRTCASTIDAAGVWVLYNNHTSAAPVFAHALFAPA